MRNSNRDFYIDLHEPTELEIDELLHPADAFEHPQEVVNDPDLTLNEKRAVLASWASDACAVKAAPCLRRNRRGSTVSIDAVLEALQRLDKIVAGDPPPSLPAARRSRSRESGGSDNHTPH
jgi:hypothetical protein